MARDRQEYGLNARDRLVEIERKFGRKYVSLVQGHLARVCNPTEQVLGAIVFLARPGRPDEVESLVKLANEDVQALLNAATVKDERG